MPALPRAKANKIAIGQASKAKAEAARKLRVQQAISAEAAKLARAESEEAEASLKITQYQSKAAAAERRTKAALTRAENTEALLASERQRADELEALLAAQPSDGKFEAGKAHQKATGVPLPNGRGLSKVAKTARGNLYAAFEDMGGVEELVRWGRGNPTEFYRIWARLIPVEVEDESKNMPLETLLDMLSKRADQTVEQAALAIGNELLDAAREDVDVEAAASLFKESQR